MSSNGLAHGECLPDLAGSDGQDKTVPSKNTDDARNAQPTARCLSPVLRTVLSSQHLRNGPSPRVAASPVSP